jgi:hypothetical protein
MGEDALWQVWNQFGVEKLEKKEDFAARSQDFRVCWALCMLFVSTETVVFEIVLTRDWAGSICELSDPVFWQFS